MMFLPEMVSNYCRVASKDRNQRTNGPVNAHLISGSSISTIHVHTKPGKYMVKN